MTWRDVREITVVALIVMAALFALQAGFCGPREQPPSDSPNATMPL